MDKITEKQPNTSKCLPTDLASANEQGTSTIGIKLFSGQDPTKVVTTKTGRVPPDHPVPSGSWKYVKAAGNVTILHPPPGTDEAVAMMKGK